MNLYELLDQTTRRHSARPAILGPGPNDRLTYGELRDAINMVADRLTRAGLRPGDCVGLHCPSGAEYIINTYAVWRCGGCVVPVPVELTDAEKEEVRRQISLQWMVSAGGTASPVADSREHPPEFRFINSAFIRFTSGTTGDSKGVVLAHETIHDRIRAANEVLRIGPEDRVVWLLSMSYHFTVSIVSYLSFGAAVVLPPNHFADAVLSAARDHRGTLIYGSPAHYAWMADSRRAGPLPNLRLALSTTAAMDAAAAVRFRERFGIPVSQALGIIEVGLPCINTDFAADQPGGVGRVLPAYQLRLEDTGLGAGLKEILFSGPGFLDAYYEPWRTRAEIMPDGWFRTGDVGELDSDGCLFLRGRTKDLISVLGMKFFPQEVEAVLASHPRIESACVLSRPDPRLGEVPFARVVCSGPGGPPEEAELLAFCRGRLAGFKIPQWVEFVAALPRTPSGKILHRDRRERPPCRSGEHGGMS